MTATAAGAGTITTSRKPVLGAVLFLIGLPVLLALVEAVSFRVQNRSNGTIISSGQEREYLLHVPESYDPSTPTPLVISMHGAAGWPAAQKETSQWNQVADAEGFIVVYPSGARGAGPRVWHVDRGGRLMADVRFISELIDTLRAAYNIDSNRIYANGLSNGGGMSFVLSCTLSDRIAAIGMVAAAQTLPWDWCPDQRPVPMMSFHGTADSMIPYRGGASSLPNTDPFPSILAWTRHWARRNRCGDNPVESVVAADVTRLEYPNCAGDAAVVLYTVREGGHSWPGGSPLPEWLVGSTSNGVDASSELWEFFRAHTLLRD